MTTLPSPRLAAGSGHRIETRGDFRVKTKKSNRTIPVTAAMVDALASISGEQGLPLMHVDVQRPYHYWRDRLHLACDQAEVERLALGDFRNTVSARLLNARTPLNAFQSLMGHSAKTALKHHARATEKQKRSVFEAAMALVEDCQEV